MISATSLTYAYPGQPPVKFPDIHCAQYEHALILGPSGTGKTTLLHLLGGLLTPSSGEISILNTATHKLRGHALDAFRGKHIGIIFQKPHFVRSLTAVENLTLSQTLAGKPADQHAAMNMMERLSIGTKANQKTHTLSIGEQQRLAIARALINRPALILADEPSSSLDDFHCKQMIDLLLQVAGDAGANLIVVTHDHRLRDRMDKKIFLPLTHGDTEATEK